MMTEHFDIDRFFDEAIKELEAKTVEELEASFAESGYYPTRRNKIEVALPKSIRISHARSQTLVAVFESANDDMEVSLAA